VLRRRQPGIPQQLPQNAILFNSGHTETIDQLGRRLTKEIDDLGNTASVSLPDESRWEFTHDGACWAVRTMSTRSWLGTG